MYKNNSYTFTQNCLKILNCLEFRRFEELYRLWNYQEMLVGGEGGERTGTDAITIGTRKRPCLQNADSK